MLIEEKYPELGKLIQAGKERGYILYEELYEKLPEEITGIAEELDDIYVRLNELEIEVMDGAEGDAAPPAGLGQLLGHVAAERRVHNVEIGLVRVEHAEAVVVLRREDEVAHARPARHARPGHRRW
mgnify:CR=1 FL=1